MDTLESKYMFWQTLRDQTSHFKGSCSVSCSPCCVCSPRMGPTRRRAHPETVPLPYWAFNEVQPRWHKGRHCVWQVMSSLMRRGAERRRLTAECSSHLMWRCFVSPLVSECFFLLSFSIKLKLAQPRNSHRFLGTNNLHVSGTESHYLISLWWHFWVCDLVGSNVEIVFTAASKTENNSTTSENNRVSLTGTQLYDERRNIESIPSLSFWKMIYYFIQKYLH